MDWDDLADAARTALDPTTWTYYAGTAGPPTEADRDSAAWQDHDLIPRFLRGLEACDTSISLGGDDFATPVMVAATAAHGLAHPEGELATARAAAATGALMVYSNSAAVDVTRFGAAATSPWWAQVYVMRDRGLTRDYLARAREAGARAIVLTVDYVGITGDARFRTATNAALRAVPGNYPGMTWPEMTAAIEPCLTSDDIDWVATESGLPVHVKGVLHAGDAAALIDTGAAGLVVSNHGRRQLAGVIPTAHALPAVVEAVAGRVPVLVDGGVRSGTDVLRALALGATAVGIGRPVLYGLTTGGEQGVANLLRALTSDLATSMLSTGAARIFDLEPSMVARRSG